MNDAWSLNHLPAFLALARTLHFTRAARELGVSQPNISRQIRALEASLGVALFVRTQRRVRLSEAGQSLFERLREPLRQVGDSLQDAREGGTTLRGPLRVGSLAELGQFVLFGKLLKFTKRHPELNLEVNYLPGAEILERVKSGALDLGVVGAASAVENLRFYPLFEEGFVLVGASGSSPPGGEDAPFVTYRQRDPVLADFVKRHAKELGFRRYFEVLHVNSHRSMTEAVAGLNAYAVVPTPAADDLIKRHGLRVHHRAAGTSKVYLVHHESEFLSRKLKALRDYLLKE